MNTMETNKASEAPRIKRVYEVFEPYCKWTTEDGGPEILEIDLKGFKKEQLKVQANEKGMLIVSGERPLDAKSGFVSAKKQHFPKTATSETKLPQQPLPSPEAQKNNNKKGTIWGVKIDKGRFLKVAVVVTAVVLVVAVARLAEVYRHPHHAAKEHHVHV
ncbi:hypothetical protein K1719_027641 [Acacia pycnantha]|nr:hypothetical protein K1719_027641 [Acacia pycnantha]